MAAQERWESRWREVTALRTEELLTLKEIGRHRHLLCKESTATPDWRDGPDVYIPTTLEETFLRHSRKHDYSRGSPSVIAKSPLLARKAI
jgi:hypothetical protein